MTPPRTSANWSGIIILGSAAMIGIPTPVVMVPAKLGMAVTRVEGTGPTGNWGPP